MGILVIAEHDNQTLKPATRNAVTAATKLGSGHDRRADLALGAGALKRLVAIQSRHREVEARQFRVG